jgi:hypothetical protein
VSYLLFLFWSHKDRKHMPVSIFVLDWILLLYSGTSTFLANSTFLATSNAVFIIRTSSDMMILLV